MCELVENKCERKALRGGNRKKTAIPEGLDHIPNIHIVKQIY